jgi:hypothetical protein
MALLEHEGFIMIYGVLFWYMGLFIFDHEKAKKKKIGVTFGAWFKGKMWNIIFTFLTIPWVIIFDDEFIELLDGLFEYDFEPNSKLPYALIGPVAAQLIKLIQHYHNKKTIIST